MSDLKTKELEAQYKGTVVLRKKGIFYHSYDESAFVLGELFNYKVKKQSSGRCRVGFPVAKLDKIKQSVEKEHVNIIVFDGDECVTHKSFDDNRFFDILGRFDKGKIVIEQTALQNDMQTLGNIDDMKTENAAIQCVSFVQGQGLSLENAIMDFQTHLNDFLESGKRIRTMSFTENTSMNNRGIFQVQGLVVFDIRRV